MLRTMLIGKISLSSHNLDTVVLRRITVLYTYTLVRVNSILNVHQM